MLSKKRLLIFAFLIQLTTAYTQHAIEPYIGYSSDQNNTFRFKQYNIGMQMVLNNKKVYNMLLTFQAGLPGNKSTGTDLAYTQNSDLPLTSEAFRETKVMSYSAGLMHRFKFFTFKEKHSFYAFVSTNILHQHIKTDYNYIKGDYTILNPHRNYKRTGLNLNFGLRYAYDISSNHQLFIQAVQSTVATNKENKDLHGYKSIAPLSCHLGFTIKIK